MKNVVLILNRLRLKANKLKIKKGAPLLGSIFVCMGFAVIVFAGELVVLTCQRVELSQGSCQLVHSRLLGSDETKIPLNQLRIAKVDVLKDSDGDSYRVVLLTDEGEFPFTSSWSGGDIAQQNADQINAFISNPGKKSLRVQQGNRWLIYPFGAIFILFGGLSTLRIVKKE